jgi:DNA-binding response OmpR family regulator
MRVLLIEDAQRLAKATAAALKQHNITVDLAFDGSTGLEYARSGEHDAIICDIMLPGLDGLQIVRQLRTAGQNTPVIMLTALGETASRVRGLDSGADDYLVKPFEMVELLARLRALARRNASLVCTDSLSFGDLELWPQSLRFCARGASFQLTGKEAALLELLLRHGNQVVAKNLISQKLWSFDSAATGKNVENYIAFLRKKLVVANSTTVIQTVRGLGYCLESGATGEHGKDAKPEQGVGSSKASEDAPQ